MADNMLYRMDRKKMGIAVIINNLDEEQIPTKKDVETMGSLLKVIGFDVKIHKNLNSEQMNSVKRDFTDPAVHRDSNCFLLCVISHGTGDNFLQDKHGAKTWNIESLVTEVSDISTLVGKPKLFFIEACRGKYRNVSQEMAKSSSSPYPLHGISLPSKQDLFVGFATVPGFVAFTASNGSPYIQALAEVLADHHHDLDLVDIHFRVRRKMTNYVTQSGARQGAEERSSLLSKLMFSECSTVNNLKKALSNKFERVTVSRQELKIAEAAMKGQLMDSWEEEMIFDIKRGIPKEDLADYADHVVDSLGIVDSPDDENHTPATDLSKLLKGMKFTKSGDANILEMNFEDDKCRSIQGFFSMIMEEDKTIAVVYAFHKLNFKKSDKVTVRSRRFLFWELKPEIKKERVKFGQNEINAIKNTFGRHKALETLKQEGILSKITYVD